MLSFTSVPQQSGTSIRALTAEVFNHESLTHNAVFTGDKSTATMDLDIKGDADSDKEDISAPVKRRRKMVLIDEEEDED